MRDGYEFCFSHMAAVGKGVTVGFSFVLGCALLLSFVVGLWLLKYPGLGVLAELFWPR